MIQGKSVLRSLGRGCHSVRGYGGDMSQHSHVTIYHNAN